MTAKERPILFSAPMVRAILAGTKTQTRRVFKPERMTWAADGRYQTHSMRSGRMVETGSGPFHPNDWLHYCPYGAPGDRLWVRETWQHIDGGPIYDAAGGVMDSHDPETIYRADHPNRYGRWRPSIHMPRWASRIDLEVTGVRVERLQDISEVDAIAEGAPPVLVPPDGGSMPHAEGFRDLWESINGDRSWAENPFVWVIEFKRIKP
jgi:hypothetical protein